MSYTYTVNKRKGNRFTFRFIGIVFIGIVALQVFTLIKGYAKSPILTALFCLFLGAYGIYLLVASFRKQAFNTTYCFDDNGITIKHRYGEEQHSYNEVEYINLVVPDEAMLFYMLSFKIGKDVYTVPFTMKKELCETIYEFVNSHIYQPEETDSNTDSSNTSEE